MPSYTPQGTIAILATETDRTVLDNGLPASVCNSCGAIVTGQDEDKHNKFHAALAKLFSDVASLPNPAMLVAQAAYTAELAHN